LGAAGCLAGPPQASIVITTTPAAPSGSRPEFETSQGCRSKRLGTESCLCHLRIAGFAAAQSCGFRAETGALGADRNIAPQRSRVNPGRNARTSQTALQRFSINAPNKTPHRRTTIRTSWNCRRKNCIPEGIDCVGGRSSLNSSGNKVQ